MFPELSAGWKTGLKIGLPAALGLLVFWPALWGGWVWDDVFYLPGNPLLNDPARLWKAWFEPGSFIEYYPLEQTVQWAQWRCWGADTLPYHLTNLALHLVSGWLVWRLLARFHLRAAWLGGLLFVIHPLNVESVAYLSELKNTLSLPPFLLACLVWIDFEENGRRRDYLLALGFFVIAMLCKISMVMFPFVLLLYAWWKRGRVAAPDLVRAAPFFIVSLLLGLMTLSAGEHFAGLDPSRLAAPVIGNFVQRTLLAGETQAFYFARFFWPATPLPMYPPWNIDSFAAAMLPWIFAAAALAFLWPRRARWGRHALLGLGFFFLNLLPFSGLMPASYMNFTWVMDHFLYLPMIGLIGLVVAGWEQIHLRLPASYRRADAALIVVLVLVLTAWAQDAAAAWADRESLWRYTVDHNPDAWLAHYNLGNELRVQKRPEEAAAEYRAALAINPGFAWAHDNLGLALFDLPGHEDEAIAEYRETLRLRPGMAEAHNNLANTLLRDPTRLLDAIAEYRAALRIQPGLAAAHYNLGVALEQLPDRQEEAKAEFREALRLDPTLQAARDRLDPRAPVEGP
jgi:tetratricopeptide (TPR) repeat protein